MFTKLRLKYIRNREIRLRLELNSGKYLPKPRFKRIHKKLRKLSQARDRLKAIREYNEQGMTDVTNEQLLEAIKENVEATKANSDAIKILIDQVVKNAEAIAEVQQSVLKIPEQISIRISHQFLDHDNRIERIEKHLDLV